MRSPFAAVAAAALVLTLAAGVAGCSTSSADEGTRSGSQTGFVGGKQLTQFPPGQRKSAPTLTGPELGTDATVSSADYAGKVLVVNVWGSWCYPCRDEADDLEQAAKKTAKKAQFLGINNRDYSEDNGTAFVRSHGITYPSIYDPSGTQLVKFAGTVPASAVPTTLVIDKRDKIAARVLGPVDATTLIGLIDDTAAGR